VRPIRTTSPYAMVSVDDALATILGQVQPLETEQVDALAAEGRVLAEAVRADAPLPAGPRSAVDGYAVRAADVGERELLADELVAGQDRAVAVGAGQAVRIMTGGSVPSDADAVIMVEDSSERDGTVSFSASPSPGSNVHRTGQDIAVDQTVLEAGSLLGPAEVGLLATVGRVRISAYRRPRVAVLATGDELVEPWERPPAGCIRDSNRYALAAAVREAGAELVWHGVASDEEDRLAAAVGDALDRCDVLITSGGVSMGTRDLIKPLLEDLGTVHFGRVNFKPGKPLTFASVGERKVFGLPGYPVSSLVTFEVFVRPALLKMQGRRQVSRPRVEVEIEHELHPDRGRPEYQRAVVRSVGGRLVARTTGGQGSSRLLSMAGANALLEIAASDEPLPSGERVTALLTGEIRQD
jgi:molybdopterin molybdotransferase